MRPAGACRRPEQHADIPATRQVNLAAFDTPADAFMVLELQEGYLAGRPGVIRFHRVFPRA